MTIPQISVMLDGLTRLGKGEVKREATIEDLLGAFGGGKPVIGGEKV